MNSTLRTMEIYRRLEAGRVVNKKALAAEFEVDEKAIQRSFQDINELMDAHPEDNKTLKYSRKLNGHLFVGDQGGHALTDQEILAVCKILLESRALVKEEMDHLIDKMLGRCIDHEDRQHVLDMIKNEKFLYTELQHKKKLLKPVFDLDEAVRSNRIVRMNYRKVGADSGYEMLLQPHGVMFSEFYFYLIGKRVRAEAEPDKIDSSDLRIYRIDRIEDYTVTDTHFKKPYADRFQEGEFRDCIQFMFGGAKRRIGFTYVGMSIEAVQDRFPNAIVMENGDGTWNVSAQVYGEGYRIWTRAQGDNVRDITDIVIQE